MERLIFTLVLCLTAGAIYLVTGRNRRQIERIPKGMSILCQPPGRRYVMYALGVLVFAFVMFFTVLFVMDGAPEKARPMWALCIGAAVLTLAVTILGGNVMARECVYFNSKEVRVEQAFRTPRTFRWEEIQTIDGSFDNAVSLYLIDGTKVLTARAGMVNYERFCAVLKAKRPGDVREYYRERAYDQPKKCVLRYGGEYYLLAVMGILLLVMELALMGSAQEGEFLEMLARGGPSRWFSLLFPLVWGVAGIAALFLLIRTNVRYSQEKMVLRYPLRGNRELYWREIRGIEVTLTKKQGEETGKKLRLSTGEGTYDLNLAVLTWGKDAFLAELRKMIKRYEIPCTRVNK